MSEPTCCDRRWRKAGASAISGAAAILLPKCPLCIAAWVAAGTGVALPRVVADGIRPSLWIVCLVAAAALLIRPHVLEMLAFAQRRGLRLQ